MYNINLDSTAFRSETKRKEKKKRKSANFQEFPEKQRDFRGIFSCSPPPVARAVRYSTGPGKLVCLRWRFSRLKGRAAKKKGKEKRRETQRNGKGRSCHIPDFPVYLDVTKRARANRDGGTGTAQEAGIATLRYIRARDFSRYAF